MSKIVIVSLLQVALAQYIPIARFDPERRNLEVRGQKPQFSTSHSNEYRLYTGQNEEIMYRNIQPSHQPLNEYAFPNRRETEHYSRGPNVHVETRKSGNVRNSDGRYNHTTNQDKNQSKDRDKEYITLSSRSHNIRSGLNRSEDITKHNNKQQLTQDLVRINKNPVDNPDTSRHTITFVELTTVPALIPMSETLKTNSNIQSQLSNAEMVKGNFPKFNNNIGTFSDVDNPKHDTLNKASTDNEVRYSKTDADEIKGDRWVWSVLSAANTTTSTSTEAVLTDGGLDDRTSFNGEACPAGEVKVKGVCTPTHD